MIAKIKEVFSKDHLTSALLVFAGFAVAKMSIGYVSPMLVDIIPLAEYDEVITVAVVVVVISLFGQRMVTLGAMVVLIDVILKLFGIDLMAIGTTMAGSVAGST